MRWFHNTSIAAKLYLMLGIMALFIAIELATMFLGLCTLSSVRAYIGAEGLWSKSQKDAISHLQEYGYSHNESAYIEFQKFMKVPLGDKLARLELQKENPDLNIAHQGFIQGNNHPHDIDGMIKLFRRFGKNYYISKVISIWTEADSTIAQLIPISQRLHKEITSASHTQKSADRISKEIELVNIKLTKLEDDFSYTLGEGARWLEQLISKILSAIAITVAISVLLLIISVNQGISRGIGEIIKASEKITKADFSVRAKVYSNDEIGALANSFNRMTNELEQNINDRKNAQNVLQQKSDELEKSNTTLALEIEEHKKTEAALEQKSEELVSANKELNSFSYSVAHDLKAPLRAINGFAMILKKNYGNKLEGNATKLMDTVIENSVKLSKLIEDLLEFSKMRERELVATEIDMNRLVKEVYDELSINEKSRTIDFKINPLPATTGDYAMIKQVWVNLIANAYKFTHIREKAEITISSQTKEKEKIYFIKDNGAGFDMKYADKLFQVFQRLHSTEEFDGNGIGLAFVKRIIEKHKGRVWAEGKMNEGATFYFSLPV